LRITFVGHATVLIEDGTNRFLTDPVFTSHIAGQKRRCKPGISVSELPPLDAILLSHAHYDHFDLPTLRQLNPETPLILPPRMKGVAAFLGQRRLCELRHWEVWESGNLRVTAVPARHLSGRWLVDTPFRPSNGYVIEGLTGAVYFAGDTAWHNPFADIGKRFSVDVALLPVGAYRPRWIMRWSHLSPSEALDAFDTLKARLLIPIHWGTFRLSLEPLDEPIRRLRKLAARNGLRDRLVVLDPGESWSPALGRHQLQRSTEQAGPAVSFVSS